MINFLYELFPTYFLDMVSYIYSNISVFKVNQSSEAVLVEEEIDIW